MSDARRQLVLEEVTRMLREVIGEQWAVDFPITAETSFSKDLELESIEFVALAEQITERYGKRVNLAAWLATMDLEQILELRVGQLVEFIAQCTSQPMTE